MIKHIFFLLFLLLSTPYSYAISPDLIINSPTNISYNQDWFWFNWTGSSVLEDIYWYSINDGINITNLSFQNINNKSEISWNESFLSNDLNFTNYIEIPKNLSLISASLNITPFSIIFYEFYTDERDFTSYYDGIYLATNGEKIWTHTSGINPIEKVFWINDTVIDSFKYEPCSHPSEWASLGTRGLEVDDDYLWILANPIGPCPNNIGKFYNNVTSNINIDDDSLWFFNLTINNSSPHGLTIDDSDYFYVGDSEDNKIYRYNPSGVYVENFDVVDNIHDLDFFKGKFYAINGTHIFVYNETFNLQNIITPNSSIFEDPDDDLYGISSYDNVSVLSILSDGFDVSNFYLFNLENLTNLYLDVANSGSDYEWNWTGIFSENDGEQEVDLNISLINTYLETCIPNSENFCTFPFLIHSDTSGILEFSDIKIKYVNSSINISGFSLGQHYLTLYGNDTSNNLNSTFIYFTLLELGTLTVLPTTKTYSKLAGSSETFNITLSHTGQSNNTIDFNLTGDINISENFTITFEEDPTVVEDSETQYILISITSNSTLASGTYTGNITWNRTEDGITGVIEITIYISAAVGNIYMTPDTISGISMYDTQSTSRTLTINNTGTRILESCNISIDSGLSSYTTFSNSVFDVDINNETQILMTLSNVPIGIYIAAVTATCTATSEGGIDTDTSSIIIVTTATPPAPITGGGGGGITPICGNKKCERGETYITCPADCYIRPNMTMNIVPEVFTIATNDNRLLERTFQLKNPNVIDIDMKFEIICIEDDSCKWIFFSDDNGAVLETITVTVPAGNIISPGLKNVNFYMDIPTDIEQKDYYFNMIGEQQTLKQKDYEYDISFEIQELSVVLPVKISVSRSFGILYILSDLLGTSKVDTVNGKVLVKKDTIISSYTGLGMIILIFISIGYVLWRREKGKK